MHNADMSEDVRVFERGQPAYNEADAVRNARLQPGFAPAVYLIAGLIASNALTGCSGEASPPPQKPSISYRTKAENANARIDKTYRLSETETIKVVIVPGFPYGERCVIYSNSTSSTMHCQEISAGRQ